MKRIVLSLIWVACTQKEPAVGGSCSPEGATHSPAPIGSGWSHTLMCQSGKWTEMEIAPLPEGRAQPTASARTLPKLDTSCNADADCAVISDETQDDAPRTYACCPSCTQRAANASWYQRFEAACATSPAPMCPPIGCAQPVARAVCSDRKCQLAKK